MIRPEDLNLSGVHLALHHMRKSGVKWPMLRTETDGGHPVIFRFSRKDAIRITGKGSFEDRFWFGSLGSDGIGFHPSPRAKAMTKEAKLDLWALLTDLAEDPETTVAKIGKRLGHCMLCGRELSNPESVERGIGPICAERAGW